MSREHKSRRPYRSRRGSLNPFHEVECPTGLGQASGDMPNGFIDIRSPESPSVLSRLKNSPRKTGSMTTVGRTYVEVLQKWGTYWLSEVKSLPKSLAPILGDFEPDCQVVLLGRNTFRALLSFSNSPPIHRITCPMTGPSSTSTASPRFPVPPPGLLVPTRTIPTRISYSSSRLPITLCTPGEFMQIAFSPWSSLASRAILGPWYCE